MAEKVCSGCCRVLPYSAFHSNASAPDGLAWYCSDCVAARRHQEFDPGSLCQHCRVCGDLRPLTDFDRHGKTATGFTNRCVPCRLRAQQKAIALRLTSIDDLDVQVEAWAHGDDD